jgi:uncharacterized protein (TIGR02145 family)
VIADPELIPFDTNAFPGIDASNSDVNPGMCGAMVYHTGTATLPAGIYIWNGYSWTKDGRLNPASLPQGSGTFNGVTRFDIAAGNDGINDCASQSAREARKTVFSDRTSQDGTVTAPAADSRDPFTYSGVQVYTFTPVGEVSHVRFGYVETSGVSVERIEAASPAYATADRIDYPCKVTVHYRAALDTELAGTVRDGGNKLKLYAIYNADPEYSDPVNDKRLELGIALQDCNACGAYTGANQTNWLNFMCHNLGANELYDPFTPAAPIFGARYKWGAIYPAVTQEEDQDPANEAGKTTAAWWNGKSGSVIPYSTSQRWGSLGTDNPCPAGWKVPSESEWSGVIGNNDLSYLGGWLNTYTCGAQFGDALLLPSTGYRDHTGNHTGSIGNGYYYWANRFAGTMNNNNMSYCLFIRNLGNQVNTDLLNVNFGVNVRCVAD